MYCVFQILIASLAYGQFLVDQLDERLRNRIESAGVLPSIMIREEPIRCLAALTMFYEKRAFQPAWITENGPSSRIDVLIQAIRRAGTEGMNPLNYHLSSIESLLDEVRTVQRLNSTSALENPVDLDILLTDAFMLYGSHLLMGQINPETIDPEWSANRRNADFSVVLEQAIESGQIEESLQKCMPPQPGYDRLRRALADYRTTAETGGWPIVPDGPTLRMGDSGERVAMLRLRLLATHDLYEGPQDDRHVFDEPLEQAARRFQNRNGLQVDGQVGRKTISALNVPAEERVHQIELNMERWRWLPQELGQCYILVNIANFELDVIENDDTVLTMRAIVGREYRRTPVFSDNMTYVVFSPHWNVPQSIALQDIVPLVQKDPDYLSKQNTRVYQGWGTSMKELDPHTIDWSKISDQNFPYHFRQTSGPNNALGRIKFMFPNKFNVYLHDTPARELFAKTERNFSSGCIRIEKPIALAEFVLRGDPAWSRENIIAAIDKRTEQTVPLPKPIPVHLLYWTAWVDEEGTVHFRRDIYGRDDILREALSAFSP
jgi:murein L,D-transpeptidase YcbB/YkuD